MIGADGVRLDVDPSGVDAGKAMRQRVADQVGDECASELPTRLAMICSSGPG
ncbi:MAG: hypothetical protein AW12_00762 [Candidatus Accumulibacter sp. BA-94]|nr:MAG: hypothetical protein AW12_00762 [Candidatus Accumulibacter sp. BA-94]